MYRCCRNWQRPPVTGGRCKFLSVMRGGGWMPCRFIWNAFITSYIHYKQIFFYIGKKFYTYFGMSNSFFRFFQGSTVGFFLLHANLLRFIVFLFFLFFFFWTALSACLRTADIGPLLNIKRNLKKDYFVNIREEQLKHDGLLSKVLWNNKAWLVSAVWSCLSALVLADMLKLFALRIHYAMYQARRALFVVNVL